MSTPGITSSLGVSTRRLLVAAVSGVMAIALLYYYIEKTLLERSGGERIPVMVATKVVKAGERIDSNAIVVQEVPKAYIHANSVHERDQNKIVGRKVYRHVADHQPILWTDFDAPESDRGPLVALTKGMRAVAIMLSEPLRKARILKTGDLVDVIFHFNLPQGSVALTLFQRVIVLEQRDEIAVLSLRPEQAERFAFAQAHGSLTLALRNRDDTEQKDIEQVAFSSLLKGYVDARVTGAASPAPVGAGKPPQQLMRLFEQAQDQAKQKQ